MRTFVVNLDRRTDRMEAVAARLSARGIAYERIPAIDGWALDAAALARRTRPWRMRFLRGFGFSPGEIGCALSHLKLYRKMADEQIDVACVLEDDAFPEPDFVAALARVEREIDVRKRQVVLLSPIVYPPEPGPFPPGLRPLGGAQFTDAYVITRSAAEAILRVNDPVRFTCDRWDVLKRLCGLELHQLQPTVSRQDYNRLARDVKCPNPAWAGTLRWKVWRAVGKAISWVWS